MTKEEFGRRVAGMMGTLYRVCYAQFCRQCDREDAVQEALRRAWEKRDTLRDERMFQTWLIRILLNECHSVQRRSGRMVLMAELPEGVAPPEADGALHDLLMALPDKLRIPVVLHYMEGYTIAECAEMIRIPQSMAKARLRAARLRLRDGLSGEVLEG